MDNFQIETAQNIQIGQNIATLGDRILALLVDLLLITVYELIVFLIVISTNLGLSTWATMLVFGLPPFLYHLIFETFNNGQSIGKAVLKIRVVRLDGSPARFSNYLLRWLLRLIDISLTSGGCALITFMFNDKGQRLGDIAAQTTVISEKQHISLQQTLQIDIAENYQPTYPQVTLFSDRDIQDIKTLFQKAQRQHQQQIIYDLAQKAASVMQIDLNEQPSSFITQVIADYNYYTQQ